MLGNDVFVCVYSLLSMYHVTNIAGNYSVQSYFITAVRYEDLVLQSIYDIRRSVSAVHDMVSLWRI